MKTLLYTFSTFLGLVYSYLVFAQQVKVVAHREGILVT